MEGVEVPGLNSNIPGLIFADDTMLFARSVAVLQKLLDQFTAWSDRYDMQIGHSKCGIMLAYPKTDLML